MTPRAAERAVDIFTGLVVASVGVALAGLAWRIAGDAGTAAIAPAGAVTPAPARTDIEPIIAFAPFGRADAEAATVATSLPLQLKGILLAMPRSASTALVAENGGAARGYAVGGSVGGARIVDIAVDRVILDVGGRRELLAFPRAPSATVAAAPAMLPPQPAGQAVEGQGFRVGSVPPPALLAAGLQPGDVIERINGIDVGDQARAREMIGGAALAGGARVDVLRGGRRFTVAVTR